MSGSVNRPIVHAIAALLMLAITSSLHAGSKGSYPSYSGNKKIAVIMLAWQDRGCPATRQQVVDKVWNQPASVRKYYLDMSRGALDFIPPADAATNGTVPATTSDIYGPYTLSIAAGYTKDITYANAQSVFTDDLSGACDAGKTLAAANGFNADDYDHLIYVMPKGATTGNTGGWGSVYGTFVILHDFRQNYVNHEIGHNFGLDHSNTSIDVNNYNSQDCVMGNGANAHLDEVHTYNLGWYPDANFSIKDYGQYTIENLAQPNTDNLKVLRFDRMAHGATSNAKYNLWIGYRVQGIGQDVGLNSGWHRQVNIHYCRAASKRPWENSDGTYYQNNNVAHFAQGGSYTDPDNLCKVRFLRHDDSGNASAVIQLINPKGNQPPSIPAQAISVPPGTTNFSINATDPENDRLSFSLIGGPSQGTLALSNGTFTYTGNGLGTYSFIVRVNDGQYDSFNTTLTLNVVDNLPTYPLTVINGSGDGNYVAGSVARINADPSLLGYRFTNWTNSSGGTLGNPSAQTTTYTMPITGPATVTANYANNSAPEVDAGSDQSISMQTLPAIPLQITPALWLDANDYDGNGTKYPDNATLSKNWRDKTGNGNDYALVQGPTYQVGEIGGNDVVEIINGGYNGPEGAAMPASGEWTVVFAAKKIFSDADGRIFDGHTGNYLLGYWNYYKRSLYLENSPNGLTGMAATFEDRFDYEIMCFARSADGRIRFYVNGRLVYLYTSTNSASGIIWDILQGNNSSERAHCQIGDFIVAHRTLTDGERQDTEGYLAHKWGLANKLPVDHSGKASPPLTLGAIVDLNGTASDGDSDNLSTVWSVTSTVPAGLPVKFANASAINTKVTFTAEGVYRLRLTANDGFNSVYDECIITVGPSNERTVTYDGNDNDSGSPPLDKTIYVTNDTVNVLGNSGNLTRVGYAFSGWNTKADGSGISYPSGSTFVMGQESVTLFAKWTVLPTYPLSVINGSGDGNYLAGANVAIVADPPASGYRFTGWTTSGGGTLGNASLASTTFTMPANSATLTATYILNTSPQVEAGPNQTVALSSNTVWNPFNITTAAWYDGSDSSTIIHSGGAVSQWNDKSGNNRHATQTTASLCPSTGSSINGLNALNFVSDQMNTPLTQLTTGSIYFVAQAANKSNPANNCPLHAATGVNTGGLYMTLQNYNSPYGANYAVFYTGQIATNQRYLNGMSAVTNHGFNPAIFSHSGSFTTQNLTYTIGCTFSAGTSQVNTKIGEIIICPEVHDAATRQKMEGYLAHKWGLATRLPDGHPHQFGAPGTSYAAADLDGAVTDAEGDPLTSTWSKVSGPGAVTFSNPTSPISTAIFTISGTYVLRLTVDDGLAQTYDDLVITVAPAPSATYLSWAGGSFANAFTLTGLNQNQDSDGMTNLQEFAFGTDPTKSDSRALVIDGSVNGLPVPVESGGGAFELYFIRRKDHGTSGSVSYTAQFSSDLARFHNYASDPVIVTESSLNTDYEVVKVIYPASLPDSQPARFGRIMVTPVP